MAGNTVTREVILTNVRLSFADLWKAKAIVDPKTQQPAGEPKFRATLLLDKDEHKELIRHVWTELTAMMKERYGEKMTKAALKHWPLREGAEKPEMEGYGDQVMFIAANSPRRPVVVGLAKQPVVEGDPQAPYSGCYVHAKVQFWTQEYMGGKQINTSLVAVMFARDGQPFSGAKFSVDEFPDGDPATAGATEEFQGDDCPV